jgi:hypothetical protein
MLQLIFLIFLIDANTVYCGLFESNLKTLIVVL